MHKTIKNRQRKLATTLKYKHKGRSVTTCREVFKRNYSEVNRKQEHSNVVNIRQVEHLRDCPRNSQDNNALVYFLTVISYCPR